MAEARRHVTSERQANDERNRKKNQDRLANAGRSGSWRAPRRHRGHGRDRHGGDLRCRHHRLLWPLSCRCFRPDAGLDRHQGGCAQTPPAAQQRLGLQTASQTGHLVWSAPQAPAQMAPSSQAAVRHLLLPLSSHAAGLGVGFSAHPRLSLGPFVARARLRYPAFEISHDAKPPRLGGRGRLVRVLRAGLSPCG